MVPHGVLAQPGVRRPLPDRPVALFFGRAEPYKGLDVLVEAVRLLPSDVPLKVVVAAHGGDAERLARDTADDQRFEWRLGFVRDEQIPSLFAESSFVVLPYRAATQSGVVPLAFANARSVVATTVGALPEAVEDGRTGMLVPPEDPNALAEALAALAADPARTSALSDAAYDEATVGRLSAASIAARHLEIYRALAWGDRDV